MSARRLFLDLETRSCADLRKIGVYRYAQDVTTDCILAAWMIGRDRPRLWLRGQPLPSELEDALRDERIQISAHNFTFERQLLKHVMGPIYGWPEVGLERWDCTMARARAAGFPGSLDKALQAVGSKLRKDSQGHSLMLRMCRPRRFEPNGRPVWWEDDTRIQRLGDYCIWDVRGSEVLDRALPELTPEERATWLMTEQVNDEGVRFDLDFCRTAIDIAAQARRDLDRDMRQVTGGRVAAASNVSGLKAWLAECSIPIEEPLTAEELAELEEEDDDPFADEGDLKPDPTLRRRDVERILARPGLPADVAQALQIRLDAGKVSTKKLDSILQRAEEDGRVRGLLGYHGASTGRYAATGGVQIQNFPRDVEADWQGAYALMLEGGYDALVARGGSVLELLSRMLRGAIIPDEGCLILNADYASVEAVGVAWLAGCKRLVAAFARKEPVYEMMASRVFGIPLHLIGKESLERFIGKTLILGAGYGMGWPKFVGTCLLQGRVITEDIGKRGIYTYREEYEEIPALWRSMERCAIRAVREPGTVQRVNDKVAFRVDGRFLRMQLPSGRVIRYRDPAIEHDERFDAPKLVYWGVNSKTKHWGKQSTYGGRLTENAVQGLCRDLTVHGKHQLRGAGYRVVTSVHDEIICEVRKGSNEHSVDQAVGLMCDLPSWARGFPLRAVGKVGERYVK